jgi:hypothetical protein
MEPWFNIRILGHMTSMDGEQNFIMVGSEGQEAKEADWTGCKMW